MKTPANERKRVMIQVANYGNAFEPFHAAKVVKRVWNEREKNAGKKMAHDFAEYLYNNATGTFWVELKRAMKKM